MLNTKVPLALQDLCDKEECAEKKKHACQKMKSCNHPCYGIKNELNCLACLHPDCASKSTDLRDADSD